MPSVRAKGKFQAKKGQKKFEPKGKFKKHARPSGPKHHKKGKHRRDEEEEDEDEENDFDEDDIDEEDDMDVDDEDDNDDDADDDDEEEEAGDDANELKKHKSELKKLRKQDPEFFEFLQENDADLLEFDDDDAEEEDFDGDESFQFGNRPKEELTSEVLKQTVERARKGALKDIKLLQGMFKLACNPTIDSDDNEEEEEQGRIPFTISSPEIYEEVMTNAIQHVHLSWARFLQVVTPLQSKAIAKLSANKKWRKLQSSVLGFFKTICTMLQSIGTMDRHHQVALFLLRSLESYIPYLAPLPRLTRSLAKLLSGMLTARINDNAQNEDNKHNFNEVRGQVLLRLRQMSIQVPGNAGEEAFRLAYLHFARACKTCTEMNSENIAFIV
eukprot:gene17166-19666_t